MQQQRQCGLLDIVDLSAPRCILLTAVAAQPGYDIGPLQLCLPCPVVLQGESDCSACPVVLQGERDCSACANAFARGRPRQFQCLLRAAARAIAPARPSALARRQCPRPPPRPRQCPRPHGPPRARGDHNRTCARAPEGTDARASPSARARGVCGSSRPLPQPLAATDGRDDASRAPAA
jgi:hypothetical protein